jgi:hypothetical protein
MAGQDKVAVYDECKRPRRGEQQRKDATASCALDELLETIERHKQQRKIQREEYLDAAWYPKQLSLLPKRRINFVREQQRKIE